MKKSLRLAAGALVALSVLGTGVRGAVASASHPTAYTYTQITDPVDPTFNQALGINNAGVVAGYYGSGADPNHPNQGFTVVPPYGANNFASENYPGSIQTQVIAVTNNGNTAGFWADANNNNYGFVEWNGVFTSVQNPRTPHKTPHVNQLLGMNDGGIAVGFYNDGKGNSHPYTYNQATGRFKSLRLPGATSAQATGSNDKGDIVGFAVQGGSTQGFLLQGKRLTEFQYSGAAATQAFGVNNSDQIVGTWTDAGGNVHGFVLTDPTGHAQWQSVSLPGGDTDTFLNGINDKGQIVGFVTSSPTSSLAYVGSPS
ncbi:MAG TPA: hypothetical protein VKX16_02345 [Chloroflexota bacterium]|nr:hypothetical protein [Chloroflexota bacterium]